MFKQFLALATLITFGWLVVAPVPQAATASRPAASRAAANQVAIVPGAGLDHDMSAPRRAPVPLVRAAKAPVVSTNATTASSATADSPTQDELDRRAAKAAVEADGYKRVTVLGRTSAGAWRAKAYRGATEVSLVVDGTGRVSQQ